jgi:hypothetical protein
VLGLRLVAFDRFKRLNIRPRLRMRGADGRKILRIVEARSLKMVVVDRCGRGRRGKVFAEICELSELSDLSPWERG